MELAENAPIGMDFRDFLSLNDVTIDVDLTSNRADCFSIRGLAREVGVLNRADVTAPAVNAIVATINDTISIDVKAPAACPRYLGRIVKNVNVQAQTPLWMQEKLRRCGIRSIDPVVDITNFVMLEQGQPMHAFDLAKIEGGIVVRLAEQDEKLTLLDGSEAKLNADTLVIADQQKRWRLLVYSVASILASALTPKMYYLSVRSSHQTTFVVVHVATAYTPILQCVLNVVWIMLCNTPRWSVQRNCWLRSVVVTLRQW